jgi:probable HAF family extracellular repeat protein
MAGMAVAAILLLAAEVGRADISAEVQYTVTDLGSLGGGYSIARGINNSGQVVGSAYTSDSQWHAFRTAANQPINPATDDLGTFGGDPSQPGADTSDAFAINDSGQVVGYADSGGGRRAFLHSGSGPLVSTDNLGTLGGPSSYVFSHGINNSGQVAGYSSISGNSGYHAFRTAANQPINPATDDLGTLVSGASLAFAINDSGQVVGRSEAIGGYYDNHAFRTAPNSPINPAIDDLGTFGGSQSVALDINNSGQVVGWADTSISVDGDQVRMAFLHSGSGPLVSTDNLGTLGVDQTSMATAINNLGTVVGVCNPIHYYGGPTQRAFIYRAGGPMQDLNSLISQDSGWVLTYASDINDLGQIVGQGLLGGQNRAFRLDPIPEPASLSLLALGGLVVIWRRRAN